MRLQQKRGGFHLALHFVYFFLLLRILTVTGGHAGAIAVIFQVQHGNIIKLRSLSGEEIHTFHIQLQKINGIFFRVWNTHKNAVVAQNNRLL